MATVRELVTSWGFKIDDKALKNLKVTMGDLKKGVAVLGATAVAAGAAMFGFALKISGIGDDLAKTARALGITTTELERLKFAAGIAGVDQTAFTLSLTKFSKAIKGADEGVATYKDNFDAMGISVRNAAGDLKKPDVVLKDIADAFQGMEQGALKTGIALELFGRTGGRFINLLNEGRVGIEVLGDELEGMGATMSTELLGASEEFADDLLRLQTVVKSFAFTIAEDLLPAISEIMKELKEFALANKDIIKVNLTKFMKGLVVVIKFTMDLFKAFIELTGELAGVLGVMGVGLTALATIWFAVGTAALIAGLKMLAIPILIAAAVAAIILIFDDLKAFFEGRDSVFGVLNEKFKQLGPVAKAAIGLILTPIRILMTAISGIVDLVNVLRGKLSFGDAIKRQLGRIGNVATLGFSGGGDLASSVGLQNFRPDAANAASGGGTNLETGDINVQVVGGATNAETGQAVSDGVVDGMGQILKEAGRDTAPVIAQ